MVIFVYALIGFFMELQARSSMGKHWLLILETSIALAVAVFPEGLPIVSTVALA